MSTMRFALIGLSLLLTACSAPEAPSVAAGDAAAEHRRIRALLYDQGLIHDPKVQVKEQPRREAERIPRGVLEVLAESRDPVSSWMGQRRS